MIKILFGEVLLLVIALIWAVLTTLLALASPVLYLVKRQSLRESWESHGEVWERIWLHYKYYWRFISAMWENNKAKRGKKKTIRSKKEPQKQTIYTSRGTTIGLTALDAFEIFTLALNSFNLAFYLAILINFTYIALTMTIVYVTPVVEKPVAPQPPAEYEYIPTDADKQDRDFGPWTPGYELDDATINDKAFLNFALIDEVGEIKYSQSVTVVPDDTFKEANSDKVHNPILNNGMITFYDNNGNGYTLNPNQAFQFMDEMYITFMFDEESTLLQAKTTDIKIQKND